MIMEEVMWLLFNLDDQLNFCADKEVLIYFVFELREHHSPFMF